MHTGTSARRILLISAALSAGFAVAVGPAHAAQSGLTQSGLTQSRVTQSRVTQISADPYTPADAPSGEHATEVEPDTFAHGSTLVTAFQVGRVFNGGATDIGFATSTNGGFSWIRGFLPGTSVQAKRPGPFFSVSDASVAYNARDRVWIISWLGAHFSGGGIVDVMASRSADGGRTWTAPVTIAASGVFYDKNWTTCDNSPSSPFYGHCYTEFDNASGGGDLGVKPASASGGDLELMSTSARDGLNWGPPTPTANSVHGLGGQPVVQPDGHVVVPFEALGGTIGSFISADGGATWNASVQVATRSSHPVAGLRTSPLPSAEINRDGTVYVVWQDNRFEPGGTANDIVLSSSADGTTWSPVSRIPLDPIGSNVDHFIPGLAVDRTSSGRHTLLALTYYFDTNPSCTGSTCQIQVGFSSSADNGQTWSTPRQLSHPMQLGWLAPTTQGAMVGDYISTSFLAGQQRAIGVFAIASAPASSGLLNEPMFAGVEKVRGGDHRTTPSGPVRFTGLASIPSATF